jgi:genome maintenance exonuclease 1
MLIDATLPAPPPLKLISYPALDRQTAPDGVRHYIDPHGNALPSVTTILSATADKAFLKEWVERVGEAKAEKIRTEATNIGSLMHENLECYLEGRERPRGNNLIRQMSRRMADVIINRALPSVDEVWGVEAPLYFPMLYAGTSDLIGVYEGAPAIMDFKTAKKIRSRAQIEDYFVQGVAYALAHNYLFETDIRTVAIFMVTRELQYETFTLEGSEFDRCAAQWQERILAYEEKLAA